MRLEKELRRGYDAGIIDNTEYTKEVFQILQKVYELRRKEKTQQKDHLKEVQKMAEEKVDVLKGELEKEGSHMDKEITGLQKEVEEWKKENEYLSNIVRRQNEATNQLQEELKKLTKERVKQDNELIQKQVAVTRLERQVQDLANRLIEQKIPTAPPSDTKAVNTPAEGKGSQRSAQKSLARSRGGSNVEPVPSRRDTKTSNAKPKVIGREFVGFTGDFEYYRRKNEEQAKREVGSLSSFYEGLLRLDKLDPNMVKKQMNGGLQAILELTKGQPEEDYEDDYSQQNRPGPPQKMAQGGNNQGQDGQAEYDDQQEEIYDDYDDDYDEEGNYIQNPSQNPSTHNQSQYPSIQNHKRLMPIMNQMNQGSQQNRDTERNVDEQDGLTGKVWGIYNPNQENNAGLKTYDEETANDIETTKLEEDMTDPELVVGDVNNLNFNEIPDELPNRYNAPQGLDLLRRDAILSFQELAVRWKASDGDDVTRTRLIQMLKEQETLKGEALLQMNLMDLLIILKNALASGSLLICQVAARILSEFALTNRLELFEFMQVHPIPAIMRCVGQRLSGEDIQGFTDRIAAAFELLNFMADQKLPWTPEMSQLLLQDNGLITILKHLQSKNEWQVAQASRIVYYIILHKELLKELREYSGMSLLIINMDSPNRTIRMNVVKGIALMIGDLETRERYLAKKDNKLDDILSKIMQNEPDFIKYLLDILANLIKNADFAVIFNLFQES